MSHKATYRRWTQTGPTLAEFLPVYADDDNAWWVLSGGDHMNLFDAAMDEVARLRNALRIIAEEEQKRLPRGGSNFVHGTALHALEPLSPAHADGTTALPVTGSPGGAS